MVTRSTKKTHKVQKTKITVLINKEVFDKFSATAKKLGLRRDAYLNQMLPEEIRCLTSAPAGSKRGELIQRTLLRSSGKSVAKVGITLDCDVAESMTKVCAEKHVLRDHFMQACLQTFANSLDEAVVAIYNLNMNRDENAYDNLAMDDKAVTSLIDKLSKK